jgi:preprotein translocase subunit SecE
MADKLKLLTALAVIIAAIGGFYYYADVSLLLRVLAMLVAVGIAVAVVMQTAIGQQAWAYVGDARTEVRKVVWPTRKETVQTTLIVMVMVLVVATLLWIFDMGLASAVKMLTGQGG